MQVALFVEGSEAPPRRRGKAPLEQIWTDDLGEVLDLHEFDPIIPISKKHLVAMDPEKPKMSGAGEALDQMIVRYLAKSPFEAAVVAWDLVPAWNPEGKFCRFNETLNLYRFLADSQYLPCLWVEQAGRRYRDLSSRPSPGERESPPSLVAGMVLALCMEPMFETILVQDEGGVLRSLEIKERPEGWPRQGWADPKELHPDTRVLAPAVSAARRIRPKLKAVRQVPGDMRTNKDGWGEYLLRGLLADPTSRPVVLEQPLVRRLAEVASRS